MGAVETHGAARSSRLLQEAFYLFAFATTGIVLAITR
jgi:hypothetical protein